MEIVRTRRRAAGAIALIGAFAIAGWISVVGRAPDEAVASSHRDAPLIAEDPTADNTDLYAWRDSADPTKIDIVANWDPAEDTAAGPNYHVFSSSARYWIKIDNTGDARADIAYRFDFARPDTLLFLRATGQRYSVRRVTANGQQVTQHLRTAPNYVGPRTNSATGTGNCDASCYRDQASNFVRTLPGGVKVFAGQRDDPFFGDIGAIFDNLAFRLGTGVTGGGKDFFAGYAVHTIALQLPISMVTTQNRPTIGIWATTERPRMAVSQRTGHLISHWVQVSRLGNPLFNEVVVPTTKKDEWNAAPPHKDVAYTQYARNSMLAQAINLFYPNVIDAPESNRSDLVAIFLTGLPNLNFTGNVRADMLRLNTSIAPATTENRMGVVGGDNAGWPNGRRLGDDVIDIAEQAVAGATFTPANPRAALLGDGVNGDDRPLLSVFPYVQDPRSGFEDPKGEQKP